MRRVLQGKSTLWFGEDYLDSTEGLHQGDPISPLLFSIGLSPIVAQMSTLGPGQAQTPSQLWYADDGLLECDVSAVPMIVATLERALLQVGLRLNHSKCEMLTINTTPLTFCPGQWQLRTISEDWEYLGAPMATSGVGSASVFTKAQEVAQAIGKFGSHHPQQALILLRQTAGCCRVEYLCKAVPPSALAALLDSYALHLRDALGGILQKPVSDEAWRQATLTAEYGGLGLRDPQLLAPAIFYANVVLSQDLASQLGSSTSFLEDSLAMARREYAAVVACSDPTDLDVGPELQQRMAKVIFAKAHASLLESCDAVSKSRLASMSVPHASAWTLSPSRWFRLEPPEFRHALRWCLGLSLRERDYTCPDCSTSADARGVHAVACVGGGGQTRGHHALRDTLGIILADLGMTVRREQSLKDGSNLIPADLLVAAWSQGKPRAVDVSIAIPAELTARGPSAGTAAEDQRYVTKMRKYQQLCEAQQWSYHPFVADAYGALSSQARAFLSGLLDPKRIPALHDDPGLFNEVWSALSGAVVS